MKGNILANRSAKDRNKTDFYPTPPDVTTALLKFLEERNYLHPWMTILEPACGTGEMVKAMNAHWYRVDYFDLYPKDFRGGSAPINFLHRTSTGCDWIITNPPFSAAEAFIRHALDLKKPCAFLLKSQFWHAKRRLQLFRENPPLYVLPLTWRPDFLNGSKSGSPTMEVAWSVWVPRLTTYTSYIPLERPQEVPTCD